MKSFFESNHNIVICKKKTKKKNIVICPFYFQCDRKIGIVEYCSNKFSPKQDQIDPLGHFVLKCKGDFDPAL